MSKFSITHSCGHEQTHQLYGKYKDRDSKAEWLGRQLCSECYAAKRQADFDAANKVAAETNAAAALPQLTGSEKQVAWAESIRAQAIKSIDGCRVPVLLGILIPLAGKSGLQLIERLGGDVAAKAIVGEARKEVKDALAMIRRDVLANTEARFWIDSRDADVLSESWLASVHRQTLSDCCPALATVLSASAGVEEVSRG